MAFIAILRLKKGRFEGGKCAAGVKHLDRCISTQIGPKFGEKERKIAQKYAKKRKIREIHTSILAFLGISGCQIVSQKVPHLFRTGVSTNCQGGMQIFG